MEEVERTTHETGPSEASRRVAAPVACQKLATSQELRELVERSRDLRHRAVEVLSRAEAALGRARRVAGLNAALRGHAARDGSADGNSPPLAGRTSPSADRSPGHEILLVDDDEGFVVTFGALLKLAGYAVVTEHTVAAALGHLSAHRPDLLITNLHVGHADGSSLIRAARRHQPYLPVVVVTAWPCDIDADNYTPPVPVFLKPFEPDALLAYLEAVCRV